MIAVNALTEDRRPGARDGSAAGANVNIGGFERWASLLAGGGLAIFGILRRSLPGAALALAGGALAWRSLSGHCALYESLGISTRRRSRAAAEKALARHGVKVEKSLTVNARPDEVYRFWRDLENLPRIMRHVESVRVEGGRSHWVAKGPFGAKVEWDAEILNERENDLIAWRSLEGAEVDHAGSVHFRPAPGDRGTEIRVSLKYNPPAGTAGTVIARLFGQDPAREIQEDLLRFKQIIEAGEVATVEGQPHGP